MGNQGWHVAKQLKYGFVLWSILVVLVLMSGSAFAAGDCSQCHGENVAAGHHESTAYQQGLCNQCHENVTTSGDCAQCHTFVPQQNAHHDTAPAVNGNCAQCHTDVGELSDCLNCHQGQIRSPHHMAINDDPTTPGVVDPIDCNSCHTNMEPLTGCLACHSGNIRDQHHVVADTKNFE